ncbi:MAG: carbon-nitrogen hydrolase family protein [Lachnospiraceae bacterium]|nr:carbon-nitrogen hydrolase family protein [Lachnospiraceae bacterium]
MGNSDILTLSVVNFKVKARDTESNLKRITGFAGAAARQGSEIAVFPELSLSGYDVFISEHAGAREKEEVAYAANDKIMTVLSETAREYGIAIVLGMPGFEDGKFYNEAVYVGEDGGISRYRKIHLFGKESKFFSKGAKPIMVNTKWGKIGLSICYDTYQFPELLRIYAAAGCRLVINPTAMIEEVGINGSRKSFENYYIKSLEYGAFCNGIYIASANLTGYDETSYFGGASGIFGPKITPFCEVDSHIYAGGQDNSQEGLVTKTIDLSLADRRIFIKNEFTGESDYRPELYKALIGA